MMRGFVISGTDTGIGKTVFAAALTGWLGACYWKPVQAGLDEISDSDVVRSMTGENVVIHPEAYRLTTPCSPHQAAAIDGVRIDAAKLALPEVNRPLIVEGAGGVLVPLNEDHLYADIFALWQLPAILVARTALGTINHSLLSIEALRHRNVPLHGIVFIGEENAETEKTICDRGTTLHLGRLPIITPLDADSLAKAFEAHIRIEAFK